MHKSDYHCVCTLGYNTVMLYYLHIAQNQVDMLASLEKVCIIHTKLVNTNFFGTAFLKLQNVVDCFLVQNLTILYMKIILLEAVAA